MHLASVRPWQARRGSAFRHARNSGLPPHGASYPKVHMRMNRAEFVFFPEQSCLEARSPKPSPWDDSFERNWLQLDEQLGVARAY